MPFLNGYRRQIADRVLPEADGIRVVSERVKKSLVERYGSHIVEPTVIPVAVDSNIPEPVRLPTHPFTFSLITVGRLEPEKRIEDIIDALSNSSTDKKLLEGVVILQWGASSPEFNKLYKDKFGADSVKSADKSYDAVYLLAEAIANSPDQASVAAYIEDNEFETVNGKIKFTKDHAAESSLVRVEVIKNGQLTSWVE